MPRPTGRPAVGAVLNARWVAGGDGRGHAGGRGGPFRVAAGPRCRRVDRRAGGGQDDPRPGGRARTGDRGPGLLSHVHPGEGVRRHPRRRACGRVPARTAAGCGGPGAGRAGRRRERPARGVGRRSGAVAPARASARWSSRPKIPSRRCAGWSCRPWAVRGRSAGEPSKRRSPPGACPDDRRRHRDEHPADEHRDRDRDRDPGQGLDRRQGAPGIRDAGSAAAAGVERPGPAKVGRDRGRDRPRLVHRPARGRRDRQDPGPGAGRPHRRHHEPRRAGVFGEDDTQAHRRG